MRSPENNATNSQPAEIIEFPVERVRRIKRSGAQVLKYASPRGMDSFPAPTTSDNPYEPLELTIGTYKDNNPYDSLTETPGLAVYKGNNPYEF
jgi:hypothetical protein